MPNTVISLHDVNIQRNDVALDAITFDVPESSCFALFGLPGAGKTTIVKALAGLVRINEGTAYVLDNPLHGSQITRISNMSLLHQGVNWSDTLTMSEFIRLSEVDFDFTVVEEALKRYKLYERKHVLGYHLTPAEKQLVGLIVTCLQDTDLVVLDAPTQGIQLSRRSDVIDIMAQLNTSRTVFFTTSRLEDLRDIASHVAILSDGRILAHGSVESILSRPESIIYHVGLYGDTQVVGKHIRDIAWVNHLQESVVGDRTDWMIWLNDGDDAPTHLLRAVLADRNLKIEHFNQVRPRLDHFLNQVTQVTSV